MALNTTTRSLPNSIDHNREEGDTIEEDGSSETDALLDPKQASVTFSGKSDEVDPPVDK